MHVKPSTSVTAPTAQLPARVEAPSSKLTFDGVSDKQNGHTGFFAYRLSDDGRIYCRWDPVLPDKPFEVSCSNRLELPVRCFDAKPWQMKCRISRIKGPYQYTYDATSATVTAAVRGDLAGKGFVLRKGKLVEKPVAEAATWHLHDKTGGPKLPKGVRIVEIQVANEIIFARASNDDIYMYNPCLPYRHQVKWRKKNGFYDERELRHSPGSRDWAAGISVQLKPHKRRGLEFVNTWTDVDSYSGSDNYRIAQGITPTIGSLRADGKAIELWDSGLPCDRHRRFLTPQKGGFVALKLAQAATYWVVLGYGTDGKLALYGRPLNYEGIGSCIGMEHSCEPPVNNQQGPPGLVHDLGDAIRPLPGKGWQKIELPNLVGAAAITDLMSAHCTGEGEVTREVRLEGVNAQGEPGVYRKGLDEEDWNFTPSTKAALKGRILPSFIPPRAQEKVSQDFENMTTLTGLEKAEIRNVSLLDFHPFQTQSEPSILRFTLESGAVVDVTFRTSDAWSPFGREDFEDEALCCGAGVPKILVGTLELPEEIITSESAELRAFAEAMLPYNRIGNLFEVIADMDKAEVYTSGHIRHYRNGRGHVVVPPWSVTFARDVAGKTLFESALDDPVLTASFDASPDQLRVMLEANQALEKRILDFSRDVSKNAKRLARRWKRLNFLLKMVQGFSTLTRLKNRPYVSALLDLLPRLVSAHLRAFKMASSTQPEGIERALSQVRTNMRFAKLLLNE